jgi:hypothetical protein
MPAFFSFRQILAGKAGVGSVAEKGRYYHNKAHVFYCLSELNKTYNSLEMSALQTKLLNLKGFMKQNYSASFMTAGDTPWALKIVTASGGASLRFR